MNFLKIVSNNFFQLYNSQVIHLYPRIVITKSFSYSTIVLFRKKNMASDIRSLNISRVYQLNIPWCPILLYVVSNCDRICITTYSYINYLAFYACQINTFVYIFQQYLAQLRQCSYDDQSIDHHKCRNLLLQILYNGS